MNKQSLLQRFKEGCEKLKPMTWAQRIDHIWTYYKAVIFFSFIVILLPVALIISFFNKKEVIFGGMAINMDMRQVGVTYLTDDLFVELGGDPKKEIVELSANAFDVNSNEAEASYNAAMSTIARVEAGTLDYIILDLTALELYIGEEIYMDLNVVFTPEELDAFGEDNIVTITPEDDLSIRTPIAINITQTAFAKDCLEAEGEIYFVFVGPEEKAESYREFWAYFMAWEQTEYHKQIAGN